MTITSPDGLYHTDIALPTGYRHPAAMVSVTYSRHATEEARKDRYGLIDLPGSIDLRVYHTVEVEVKQGRVAKIVARGPLDNTHDKVIVLMPQMGQPWFVKTVWINRHDDLHRTLDHSRYVH
jgi:hypothetical protein